MSSPWASCITISSETTVSGATVLKPGPSGEPSGPELAHGLEDLGRMPARVDPVARVADHAFLVDDESRAHEKQPLHAVGLLFLQHAVFAADLALEVRQQVD